MEEWADVPGFAGCYIVSNKGRIKRLEHQALSTSARGLKYKTPRPEMMLSPSNNCGYKQIILLKNGKRKKFWMHRLVMEAFKGESRLFVNHIDSDKSNNNIENLEYCTHKENMKHAKENNRMKKGEEKTTHF